MNEKARELILSQFCRQRGISIERISGGLAAAVYASSTPYLLMIECLDQLDSSDPIGGLLAKLVDRAHGATAGALALVALGHFREAEILARSILESSVTTTYIANNQPRERIIKFFNSYTKQERDQLNKWEADLRDASLEIREDHKRRIHEKRKGIKLFDAIISKLASHFKLDSSRLRNLPKLPDMMSDLGYRIEYRTVYAAMCSQAHHDAEDIINFFIANSIDGDDSISGNLEQETDVFSLFMLLFSLRWFVQAVGEVAKFLLFPTVIAQATQSNTWILEEMSVVVRHLDLAQIPQHWLTPQV